MRDIALNFFPLATDQFTITLYRLPFVENERPVASCEHAVQRRLEVDGEYRPFWTLFQQTDGGTEVVCDPFDNVYVTLAALRLGLIQSCRRNLPPSQFSVPENFRRPVEITIARYPEGSEVVILEAYLLRSSRKFGFLADFHFRPHEEHRGTRKSLQLSLALDKHGQPNPNYYADRYSQLVGFMNQLHGKLFPIHLPGGHEVHVLSRLVRLTSDRLNMKSYVVGSDEESRSQFMGVRKSGPLQAGPQDTHLYFIFRPEDRPLSHDLFRALRGDTFPTFPGMEPMFGLPVSNDRVTGVTLADFNSVEILRIRDRVVQDAKGRNVVPIVLTPFSRHDAPDKNTAYWGLKHAFLTEGLPIQVVATETVANKNKLKWSAAGIGLQVFAKAGGTPWKVRPRTERCLIVGIGQAHQRLEKRIDRYFAYSVLTDSSGVFEEVRILGQGHDEGHYLQTFSDNLRNIFVEFGDRFSSFVVHTSFTIRQSELESIAAVLSEQRQQIGGGDFVAIKFDDRTRFFGFALDHNSRVPYESTMIRLSRDEFLVWFEGLQYGQSTVRGMVGRPLHVKFTYPAEDLTQSQRQAYLQDAINLSGANWRGFNAKSLPVSVYYAQLIARYLKEFEGHGLPPVDVQTLTPWFL